MTREPRRAGTIVVTGMCCYLPIPGVVYQVLHYLIALRRLGYDVYYVEESDRWLYDMETHDVSTDGTRNVGAVAAVFEAHGFEGRWAFRGHYAADGNPCYGMTGAQIDRLYRRADALLNVTGQLLREEQLACRRRTYIESDPFGTQVRALQGDPITLALLASHDTHFSFGENIGADDCDVPTAGIRWLPTRQPVALELWDVLDDMTDDVGVGTCYTTITTWLNRPETGGLVYRGDTYHWQKHLEFEKVLDLPLRCRASFELATTTGEDVQHRLRANGWRYAPATGVFNDAARYRSYIRRSRAEFTIARDQYVRPRTGWFSDRSACYLAAGRPVITQDTGFGKFVPTGRGLFAFRSMDDILDAVDRIESDYTAHRDAAREIASECFAAERVVGSLMDRVGV